MAGHPFLRALLASIKTRGGWSPILERIASGEPLVRIAKDYKCSRWSMYKLINKNERLRALFQEARRQSAFALAEEGTDILDDLVGSNPTREDVALARERVAQRRWLAGAYDRETFGIQSSGDSPQGISIGALHLKVLLAPDKKPQAIEARVVEQLPSGQEKSE